MKEDTLFLLFCVSSLQREQKRKLTGLQCVSSGDHGGAGEWGMGGRCSSLHSEKHPGGWAGVLCSGHSRSPCQKAGNSHPGAEHPSAYRRGTLVVHHIPTGHLNMGGGGCLIVRRTFGSLCWLNILECLNRRKQQWICLPKMPTVPIPKTTWRILEVFRHAAGNSTPYARLRVWVLISNLRF